MTIVLSCQPASMSNALAETIHIYNFKRFLSARITARYLKALMSRYFTLFLITSPAIFPLLNARQNKTYLPSNRLHFR